MFARLVLTTMTVVALGTALSGCIGAPCVDDRPGVAVDQEGRRGERAGRNEYRVYRRAHRDQFCAQYPGDPVCFGRRD